MKHTGEGRAPRYPYSCLSWGGHDSRLVDDAVVLGLFWCHEEVAVAVLLDLLDGLTRVVRDVLAEQRADEEDLLRLDLDVRSLLGGPSRVGAGGRKAGGRR